MKILVIGGVAGGASFAARCRRLNENAEIIIFEKSANITTATCGLPYYIGNVIEDRELMAIMTPEVFSKRYKVDVRVLNEVVAIDRKNKKVKVKRLKTGETYEESYDKLIISTGLEQIVPNIEGIDNDGVFTLRTVADADKIKNYIEKNKVKKAIVVGGGYSGVEMAENLVHLGIDVHIVDIAEHILMVLDADMANQVQEYMMNYKVKISTETGLKAIKKGSPLKAVLSSGEFETDMVIISMGGKPETRIAVEAGLPVNKRGQVIVDEHMRTEDKDIYALGDASEVTNIVTGQKAFIPLAGPANKQGRIVADNVNGIPSVYKGSQGSAVLKIFDLTMATTGINERTAIDLNINYDKVYTRSFSSSTYYPGATVMWVKTIFEKDSGKILGAQIVGQDGVDKRADVLAVAIRAGMTGHDLTELELCYAPPFSSAKDPVNMIGYVIENTINGRLDNHYWHDVKHISKKDDVIFLDVRAKEEIEENGMIEGAINIPLDELRDNLDKLDKAKTIYVNCEIGLRSYIACSILKAYGYDCNNLCGGHGFYRLNMGR